MTTASELSLSEAVEAIAQRKLNAADLRDSCFQRIQDLEPEIKAFEFLDLDRAFDQSRHLEKTKPNGPLQGIPVGIKDIIDTHDMPTAWGSSIYADHRPARDAGCVAVLRAAGAIIPGKTVTTEFACFHPGKTRNPHDLKCTPGGSSMGSAASVAARMVPFAIGSQTAASVTRPAAYCGVVGYKASRGAFDLGGVCALSQSLDSLGFFVRAVRDLRVIRSAILGASSPPWQDRDAAPRIGLVRTPHWSQASKEVRDLLESVAVNLEAFGARIEELEVGPSDGGLTEAHETVMGFEVARARAYEFENHRTMLSSPFQELMERGLCVTYERYRAACMLARDWHHRLGEIFLRNDVLLTPSAPGVAPRGLHNTGNPLFSRMWSLLGLPSVALPVNFGQNGLPLGLQVVGPFGEDGRTILKAEWIEACLK